ncbi:MAG: hypothetical protein LBG59_07040 [Candidatus Peribacteria bacterium]|jgi:hypothetical protein|nr:hypothetical protein [Candidatus Peribacteria bacterium]
MATLKKIPTANQLPAQGTITNSSVYKATTPTTTSVYEQGKGIVTTQNPTPLIPQIKNDTKLSPVADTPTT